MSDSVRGLRSAGSSCPDFSPPQAGVRGRRAPARAVSLPGRSAFVVCGQFVAGNENRLVPVAWDAVLETKDSLPLALGEGTTRSRFSHSPNPIVFYGPSGVGKSLLAQGLAEAWNADHPQAPALLISGADFARAFSQAADAAELILQRDRFHSAALLILDDLRHIAAKPAAQQELLHTLDAVAANGGKTVVFAPDLPSQISKLSAPLAGRLIAGLTVPLAPPGTAARVEIVRRFAAERGIDLPAAAARMLGEAIKSVAPELQSAVIELAAQAELADSVRRGSPDPATVNSIRRGSPDPAESTDRRSPASSRRPSVADVARSETGHNGANANNPSPLAPHPSLSLPLVRKYLLSRAAAKRPSLKDIAAVTAKYFQLKVADLRSASRRRNVVTARGIAIYLARELTGGSLAKVGSHFGGRDHTTVLHSYRSTEERLRTDPATRRAVTDLRRLVALV